MPWREEIRKIRNRIFYTILGGIVVASFLILGITHFIFQSMIEKEQQNILVLQTETKKISEKIKEILNLQQDKKDLLHRMEVVQLLQASRNITVRLFDMLPRVTPDGIFLTEIVRKGDQITISGNAQTNASVSLLIENLQDKKWNTLLSGVELDEISSNKTGGLDFKVKFQINKSV